MTVVELLTLPVLIPEATRRPQRDKRNLTVPRQFTNRTPGCPWDTVYSTSPRSDFVAVSQASKTDIDNNGGNCNVIAMDTGME